MNCQDCSLEIDEDSSFCKHCGAAQSHATLTEDKATAQVPVSPEHRTDQSSSRTAWALGAFVGLPLVVLIAVAVSSGGKPASPAISQPTPASITEAAAPSPNASLPAETPTPTPPPSPWDYSSDEDKMRGGTKFYAATTSTNSVYQDSPYDSDTRMTMTLRKGSDGETDVILTISSGQMMCPSYEGCSGRVRFDDGPASIINFNGPADDSSETIFVEDVSSFIAKLKKSKKVIIEKTLYQAGNPQFEFDVKDLRWNH